jgi:hypothetical protein
LLNVSRLRYLSYYACSCHRAIQTPSAHKNSHATLYQHVAWGLSDTCHHCIDPVTPPSDPVTFP